MSGGEDKITAWFAKQSKASPEQFPIGIGDDMAEVRISGDASVLITTDMLLDGTHFDLSKTSIEQAAYKAMAVSLSDCAAMATIPVAAVVAVGLPKGFTQEQLKELHDGICRAGDKYNCTLIGGDITSWSGSERLVISVAMMSKRSNNEPVQRNGAKVGDVICITGKLGGSGAGKHLTFEPRVNEALKLCEIVKINSMMDISDGLSTDLNRICKKSNVGAVIEAEKIPISEVAMKSVKPLDTALNDGEDFELLFTLGESQYEKLTKLWVDELEITAIGEIIEERKLMLSKSGGTFVTLVSRGYDHLKL